VDGWDTRVVLRSGVTSCCIGGLARQGLVHFSGGRKRCILVGI